MRLLVTASHRGFRLINSDPPGLGSLIPCSDLQFEGVKNVCLRRELTNCSSDLLVSSHCTPYLVGLVLRGRGRSQLQIGRARRSLATTDNSELTRSTPMHQNTRSLSSMNECHCHPAGRRSGIQYPPPGLSALPRIETRVPPVCQISVQPVDASVWGVAWQRAPALFCKFRYCICLQLYILFFYITLNYF
jgi:hypothetical protein